MKMKVTELQAMEGNWIYTFKMLPSGKYIVKRNHVQLPLHAPSACLLTTEGWSPSLNLETSPIEFNSLHEAEAEVDIWVYE